MEPEQRLLSAIFCRGEPTPKINDQDWRVFDFIEHFISQHGYSPSSREIMEGALVSSSRLGTALRKLRSVGAINYKDGHPRTIVVIRYGLTEKGRAQTLKYAQ